MGWSGRRAYSTRLGRQARPTPLGRLACQTREGRARPSCLGHQTHLLILVVRSV